VRRLRPWRWVNTSVDRPDLVDPDNIDIPAATGTGTKNYSSVRVEGLSVGFGIFKRQVSVGISYGLGPC